MAASGHERLRSAIHAFVHGTHAILANYPRVIALLGSGP